MFCLPYEVTANFADSTEIRGIRDRRHALRSKDAPSDLNLGVQSRLPDLRHSVRNKRSATAATPNGRQLHIGADNLAYTLISNILRYLARRIEMARRSPVTSADCIASMRRRAARDVVGQRLMASVQGRSCQPKNIQAPSQGTLRARHPQPGQTSSNVPFMMPNRSPIHRCRKQISDVGLSLRVSARNKNA